MSIPDGSRQSTSLRSDSAIRSVGRSRIDGRIDRHLEQRAEVAELEAAVDQHGLLLELAERDRQVEGDRRLADPTLRREDADDPRRRERLGLLELLARRRDPGHQVEPGERHREDAVDARVVIDLDRVLRDRQDDDRDADLGLVDQLDELRALDPTLEKRVDEDDIGAELVDRRDDAASIGQDVEELDPRLRVEQAADVLGDLGDIFDDQEPNLVTRWHPPDDTTRLGGVTRPEVPVGP